MSRTYHEKSAKIVNQAIEALGLGRKGLADKLNKDPSLISRYASGTVRPKAETLLKCISFIKNVETSAVIQTNPTDMHSTYSLIKKATLRLTPENNAEVIETIFKILQLAKKLW